MSNIDRNIDRAFAGKKTLLQDAIGESMDQLIIQMKAEAVAQIQKQFYTINFERLVQELISVELSKKMKTFAFPDKSIPHCGIDFNGLEMSGDNISGGSISDFSSSGIEDKSEKTQLTVLDGMVVVENEFVTKNISVKGDAVFEGDVIFNGRVPIDDDTVDAIVAETASVVQKNLAESLTAELTESIYGSIKNSGIDVQNILVAGKTVVDGESLGSFIKNTKITSVGNLKKLTVDGSTDLGGTLFTAHKRVGINTTEPSAALSVWDEEVEITTSKRKAQTGYFGTIRSQGLVLGSNNQENIVMGINGETTIKNLIVDNTRLHSSSTEPNFAAPPGSIVFNSAPVVGKTWGWISLGETRWAELGRL